MKKNYLFILFVLFSNLGLGNNYNLKGFYSNNSVIVPTFNSIGPICFGSNVAALPTTSLNGITGTWSPAINNTVTTIYTFTPNPGQDATTTSIVIEVIPIPTTTIFCEQILPTVLRIDWSPIMGATNYNFSYSIDGGTTITGSGLVSNYQIPNFLPGQSIIFTLTDAIGVPCFQPISTTCGTLNNEDLQYDTFNFSPNPIVDVLNVNSINTIKHIDVFNLLGQRVYNTYCDTKSIHLNMIDFSPGIYIVKIDSDKGTNTFRVLKK